MKRVIICVKSPFSVQTYLPFMCCTKKKYFYQCHVQYRDKTLLLVFSSYPAKEKPAETNPDSCVMLSKMPETKWR